jgi:hypothetical protein
MLRRCAEVGSGARGPGARLKKEARGDRPGTAGHGVAGCGLRCGVVDGGFAIEGGRGWGVGLGGGGGGAPGAAGPQRPPQGQRGRARAPPPAAACPPTAPSPPETTSMVSASPCPRPPAARRGAARRAARPAGGAAGGRAQRAAGAAAPGLHGARRRRPPLPRARPPPRRCCITLPAGRHRHPSRGAPQQMRRPRARAVGARRPGRATPPAPPGTPFKRALHVQPPGHGVCPVRGCLHGATVQAGGWEGGGAGGMWAACAPACRQEGR